jgi:hypothetical protein
VFSSSSSATPTVTRHGRYEVRLTSGITYKLLRLGLQQRMGEAEVAEAAAGFR